MRDLRMPASVARPLKGARLDALHSRLDGRWKLVRRRALEREFKFKDFRSALAFTNRVGAVAEKLDHHPDVFLAYGKVRLSLSTRDFGGLSEKDFKLARRLDRIAVRTLSGA